MPTSKRDRKFNQEGKAGFDGPRFDDARGYVMDHANGHPWYAEGDYTYQNYKKDEGRDQGR